MAQVLSKELNLWSFNGGKLDVMGIHDTHIKDRGDKLYDGEWEEMEGVVWCL